MIPQPWPWGGGGRETAAGWGRAQTDKKVEAGRWRQRSLGRGWRGCGGGTRTHRHRQTHPELKLPGSSGLHCPPSPARAGPGFGARGGSGDLQGSSSLGDEGTPAGETGQRPQGRQSEPPDPTPEPPTPQPGPPRPPRPPLLLPFRHGLGHQFIDLCLLVPRKKDIKGFVICKRRREGGFRAKVTPMCPPLSVG